MASRISAPRKETNSEPMLKSPWTAEAASAGGSGSEAASVRPELLGVVLLGRRVHQAALVAEPFAARAAALVAFVAGERLQLQLLLLQGVHQGRSVSRWRASH